MNGIISAQKDVPLIINIVNKYFDGTFRRSAAQKTL